MPRHVPHSRSGTFCRRYKRRHVFRKGRPWTSYPIGRAIKLILRPSRFFSSLLGRLVRVCVCVCGSEILTVSSLTWLQDNENGTWNVVLWRSNPKNVSIADCLFCLFVFFFGFRQVFRFGWREAKRGTVEKKKELVSSRPPRQCTSFNKNVRFCCLMRTSHARTRQWMRWPSKSSPSKQHRHTHTHTHTHTQKERESKKENRSECWPQRRGDTSDRSNCGKISIRNRRLDPHTHTHTHTLNGIWTESSRRIHNWVDRRQRERHQSRDGSWRHRIMRRVVSFMCRRLSVGSFFFFFFLLSLSLSLSLPATWWIRNSEPCFFCKTSQFRWRKK